MKSFFSIFLILLLQSVAAQVKPGTVYPHGKPGIDYNVLDSKGKRDGLWIQQWKETRNLLYKGFYKNAIPVGEWQRYYPDGGLMAVMNYVKDTTIVDASFYHSDGETVMSQGRFIKKKKEANWKLFNESGTLISDENFKDSLLDGTCKYFYASGKSLQIVGFKNGLKDGPFTEYYENGKKRAEGSNLLDERDGAYKAWFESGSLDCEGRYAKGLQHGTWYFNNSDGSPKISLLYEMGKEKKRRNENGTFKEYYDSTIPRSEYIYEDGKRNGPFTEWYDKGQYVQAPGSKEDQEAGIVYREKLEGTQIKMHGDYMDDKLEGDVVYFRENGSIDRIEEWVAGVLIRTRQASK